MKVIYVAGKYSDDTVWKEGFNILKAGAVAADIWQHGMAAICPHMNTARMNGVVEYTQFMKGDFEILSRCDAVFMMDNYIHSEGAKAERACALRLLIPVFYNIDELYLWGEKQEDMKDNA